MTTPAGSASSWHRARPPSSPSRVWMPAARSVQRNSPFGLVRRIEGPAIRAVSATHRRARKHGTGRIDQDVKENSGQHLRSGGIAPIAEIKTKQNAAVPPRAAHDDPPWLQPADAKAQGTLPPPPCSTVRREIYFASYPCGNPQQATAARRRAVILGPMSTLLAGGVKERAVSSW